MSYRHDFGWFVTALSGGLLAGGVYELWTDWPHLSLQSWTWFSIGSVVSSIAIAPLMYLGVFGTTRRMQALFACGLIVLCIANYISIEQIEAELRKPGDEDGLLLYLATFTKHAASLGVGALAVNLLASTFPTRNRTRAKDP